MKEQEAMDLIRELVEHDQFMSLLYSELLMFSPEDADKVFVDAGKTSDLIPGFNRVIHRMNELLRIDNVDEMVSSVVEAMKTVWAFQLILNSVTNDDYELKLYSYMNRDKVREGLTDEQIVERKKEIRKLIAFMEHSKVYLATAVKAEKDAQELEKKRLQEAAKKKKAKKPEDDNQGYG